MYILTLFWIPFLIVRLLGYDQQAQPVHSSKVLSGLCDLAETKRQRH